MEEMKRKTLPESSSVPKPAHLKLGPFQLALNSLSNKQFFRSRQQVGGDAFVELAERRADTRKRAAAVLRRCCPGLPKSGGFDSAWPAATQRSGCRRPTAKGFSRKELKRRGASG